MPEANTGDAPAVPAATLDFSVIESLRQLGSRQEPNLLGELIDVFLVDARTRVSNIERASRKEDPAALEAAAHGLKSSAANLGLWRLSELCRQLERAGHTGRLEGARSKVEELKQEYELAEKALMEIRDQI
jgi:HPt (histidine-containing phosphotransfer) domain-containing protein